MNTISVLVGLLSLLALTAYLVRLVARDGLGTNAAPRSHLAELGSWVDQELRR